MFQLFGRPPFLDSGGAEYFDDLRLKYLAVVYEVGNFFPAVPAISAGGIIDVPLVEGVISEVVEPRDGHDHFADFAWFSSF